MPFCGADLLCVCMDFAEWVCSYSAYRKEMNGLFMPVRLFIVSADYGKTPTIQPSKALLQ